MTATHQYVVEVMAGTAEEKTARLNQIAGHGWRVISSTVNQFGHLTVIFEKPAVGE